jgi:hypothetical protein
MFPSQLDKSSMNYRVIRRQGINQRDPTYTWYVCAALGSSALLKLVRALVAIQDATNEMNKMKR